MINKLKIKKKTQINNTELIVQQKLKIPYPNKSTYNLVIPANIFQTWHTKDLPPLMKNAVQLIKHNNPKFNYELYDDNDCREFIKNNFNAYILFAYDNLIPGAYKADLWRYCVLYIKGGIYLDIKYQPANGFRFINLLEKEHWVLDADNTGGVYNALMVCKPKNKILLYAINQIVRNVRQKYYGNSCLDPTGPGLLGKYFNNFQKSYFDMKHIFLNFENGRFISFNNFIVFKTYNNYLNEFKNTQKVEHYSSLWLKREIYK